MPPLAFQFAQLLLLQIGRSDWRWSHRFSKGAKHPGINAIRFGQNTAGPCKLPYPIGVYEAHSDLCTSKCLDQHWFIAATRFANHLHDDPLHLLDPTDQLTLTHRIV